MSCHIGVARIWSDFKLHADGYGRLIVLAGGMAPTDLGRIVQRLQELGNHRNLALLGLPLAQSEAGRLAALERRLEQITRQVSKADSNSEAGLLDDLCNLVVRSGRTWRAELSARAQSQESIMWRAVRFRLTALAPMQAQIDTETFAGEEMA